MILAPFASARPEAQGPTRDYLARVRDGGRIVTSVRCENATSYPDAVLAAWDAPGDLVIVEHDIVPRPETLDEFDDCIYAFCTSPYVLWGGSCSLIDLATRVALPGAPEDYTWQYLRVMSGLGCVRLRSVRRDLDTSSFAGVWDAFDERISRAILAEDYGWHVHPPVLAHTGRP